MDNALQSPARKPAVACVNSRCSMDDRTTVRRRWSGSLMGSAMSLPYAFIRDRHRCVEKAMFTMVRIPPNE
jgi:hypothetical protein